MTSSPSLSVVVIGRNEGERLKRCLHSVRLMDYPAQRVELIYVDSSSTDGSVEAAASLGAKTIVLDTGKPTAARARNAGIQACSGDFVLFLDGDTILDPAFVSEAMQRFSDFSLAVVCGERRELYPTASVFNRVVDLDWNGPSGLTEYCGGDALVRRAALAQTGGYDETLIAGEEPELCTRMRSLGWRILRIDHAMTLHDIAMFSCRQYWRRCVRTGYAFAQISHRFEATPWPLWTREASRNQTRALVLSAAFLAASLTSLLVANAWPMLTGLLLLALLALRTAVKSRAKSGNLWTLVLYGLHSHLQQIPIYIGQLQYAADVRRGRSRALIEYKAAP